MSAIQSPDRSVEGAAQPVERAQLEKARLGNREAQAWLVEQHQDAVYGLAHRLSGGNPHQAEELAQEAFLRALRALPRFRGEASFGTWMHRIVVNLHINRSTTLAARARRQTLSLGESGDEGAGPRMELEDPDQGQRPDEKVSRQEQQGLLLQALEQLDDDRRTVVVLRDLEGCSYEEIAEQLSVPIGTVRSRLFRAREQLRERLLQDRAASPPGETHRRGGFP